MFNQNVVLLWIVLIGQQLQGMATVRRFARVVASAATMMAAGRGVRCSEVEEYRCFGEWDCPKSRIIVVDQAELVKYPELSKLVEMYRCSEQVLANQDAYVYKSSFHNSDQLHRIVNAERMKRMIEQEGLDRLYVPDKCICGFRRVFTWKKEGDLMNRVIVQEGLGGIMAKKIDGNLNDGWSRLSLIEVKQLAKLAEKTGYYDWHPGNYIRDSQGRLALIDTEDRSFMEKGSQYKFLRSLWYSRLGDYMEPDAQKWLKSRIRELSETSDMSSNQVVGLKGNAELDAQDGVDRELSKREFGEYWHRSSSDYYNKHSAYRQYQDELWSKRARG